MNEQLEDEVTLLESMFSATREKVEILGKFPKPIIGVDLNAGGSVVHLVFELCPEYPNKVPNFQISSKNLSREEAALLVVQVKEQALSAIVLGDFFTLKFRAGFKKQIEKTTARNL